MPASAVHTDLRKARRTLKLPHCNLSPTLAAPPHPLPAALLSHPSRRSWSKNRDRKALVQQIHKSFHSMIIYELDHKLMTVALKKEFLAAEQLA